MELAGHRIVENLGHQRETVINTAQLAGHAVKEMGRQVVHSASETYDSAREGVAQGAQMLKQQSYLVAEVMSDGVLHMADTLRHPSSWFDSESAAPSTPVLLDNPIHPGHAMFQQSLHGVQQLNTEHHIAPSERDKRFAGALTAAAMAKGLSRIDQVALGADAEYAFAAQGAPTSASWKVAQVPTVGAISTPIEQSSRQWEQTVQQQQREQEQQMTRQQESRQASRHAGLSM